MSTPWTPELEQPSPSRPALLPPTNQRRQHPVPLSAQAVAVLKGLRAEQDMGPARIAEPVVFGRSEGQALTDIRRTWLEVCRTAGSAEWVQKRVRTRKLFPGPHGKPLLD